MEEGEGKSGGHKTSFTTSIVVMPPYEFWEQLQVIRSQHDKGYVRWPPHINMAYPFLPQEKLQDAAIKLAAAFQSVQPFPLRFDDFDLFEHGKSSCTVWLKPEPTPSDALHVLQQIMEREFPECNELSQISESGFTPHLSIANDFKTKGHSLKMIAEWKKSFKPFEFTVKEVYIISRSGFEDPFEVRHVVPLGTTVTPPHFAPNPIPSGAKVLSETRILVQNVPVNILEDELKEQVTQAIDFPLDKYSVKLIRKNKTSGRQNKNTGRAFIDVKSKEQQQKILALDTLTWEGETMTLSAANA